MNKVKRVLHPVVWATVMVWSLMLSPATQADSGKLIEAGRSVIHHLEVLRMEVPERLKTQIQRIESHELTAEDPSRTIIRPVHGLSAAFVYEVVEKRWNGSDWETAWKDIITMNDAGTEISSLISQEWINGAWVNIDRMVMTYNPQGDMLSMAVDLWRDGTWVASMLMSYTYDGSGNLIEDIMQMDSDDDGVLEYFFRTVYTYSGGRMTKSEDYTWYGTWQKTMETTYTYNSQGQLIEEVSLFDLGYGYQIYTEKIIYTYHGNGQIETETRQSYQGTWENAYRYTYAYNANAQRTSSLEQAWVGSAWENVYLSTSVYEGLNGEETEALYQTWDGAAWVNVNRSTYGYDSRGNQTSWLDESWNGSSWENDEQGTTTYNSSNLPEVTIIQLWTSGAWINDTRLEYSYPGGTDVADSPHAVPESFALTNYPNPFNPSTIIRFALPATDQVSVAIYDATGRLIRTLLHNETVGAGVHEIRWDGTNAGAHPVASGVYFYSVRGSRFTQTRRCLLLK